MDGSGFVTESEILRAVGGEPDGECVVFLADWEGWYVILFLFIVQFWGALTFSMGSIELSLTVPITNSLAFLFTVLGEWWAEGKVIGRDTWVGMAFVLGGIALCVQSKSGG